MTAINVIRHRHAVHLLTDGAAYDKVGRMSFEIPKVLPLLHFDAVVAGRGSPLFAPNFAFRASVEAKGIEDLRNRAVGIAKQTCADIKPHLEMAGAGDEFDLVIAGLSSEGRPCSYFLCNHHGNGESVPPYELIDLSPISMCPISDAITRALDVAYPAGVAPDDFDPIVDGLRVLEIQRKYPTTQPSSIDTMRGVGAFAQLTTVTKGKITMEIIRRWPDKIGSSLGGEC